MPPACPCCAKADAEYSRTDSVSSEALKRFIRVIPPLLNSRLRPCNRSLAWAPAGESSQIEAHPERDRIQCVVDAAGVSELQIHVAIRVGTDTPSTRSRVVWIGEENWTHLPSERPY